MTETRFLERPPIAAAREAPSIGDYAVLGDCRSAALVSRSGSIDWLCWPRFDSPSLFAAILDPAAGFWRCSPERVLRSRRRYLPRTNVLETRYECETGELVLTEFMPVVADHERTSVFKPEHELLRIARCEEGEVDLRMVYEPRPRYGSAVPTLRETSGLGFRAEIGSDLLTLRTDLAARITGPGRVEGRAFLRKGQMAQAWLSLSQEGPAVLSPLGASSWQALDRTIGAWEEWTRSFHYHGPYREAVLRSVLALKLLVYAPSGAIIAAPTTSLPERPGGDLNWDYRYSWLRDASLTVHALYGAGFVDEATMFSNWLLHATALTEPELRILYDVFGRDPGPEATLEGLRGHAGSRPVRIGNAARGQLQLDVYGEVLDSMIQAVDHVGAVDRDTGRLVRSLGRFVARNWSRPDEGIWEPRSGQHPHTHSRLLCWTALDRLIELQRKRHLRPEEIEVFERERGRIRHAIETESWNPGLESYVSEAGGTDVDASLLLLPWYGFEPADSFRMRSTYRRIRERLGAGRSLLYRYRSGDSPGEGAFGIASFWGVEYLALGGGTLEEAERAFEDLLGYANDVGLFGEEIDPATGAALGNFPQGFSHVGLVNAAVTLERRRKGEPMTKRKVSPAPPETPERRKG